MIGASHTLVPEESKPMVDGWSEQGTGLVLAGAVAQGAFGAGAVTALAKKRPRILQIAGTSSGALNASLVAAGVVAGNLERATSVLTTLWLDHGSWADIAHVRVGDWFHARGLLDTQRLSEIVQEGISEILNGSAVSAKAPVTLTLVTTNLDGRPRPDGVVPLPTYEQPIVFTEKDFIDPAKWPEIANAAVASATFPGIFAPTKADAAGGAPCIDGGAVNNAPISYVLKDSQVGRVVVVTSESSQVEVKPDFGGTDLVAKVADAIVHERIAYDLVTAHKANKRYEAIGRALDESNVSPDAKARVLLASGYRPVELYLVHPDPPLAGDGFSGFFDRAQRNSYIEAGERAPMIAIS
jgi:NTE family protein